MITQVSQYVWRGPRPQPADFVRIVQQFASVLSLEGLAEDRKEAQELDPVEVLSFPISFFEIYIFGISQAKLANILAAIDRAKKPVLVHCQHGQDRTGLVIATYRVRVQGWTKERAMAEARALGYRWYINYGLNRTWEKV